MVEKHKLLLISDHALSTSGVGTQSRWLSLGLIGTGKYTIRQLGGALHHENLDIVKVSDDFIIKPVNGFGTQEMIRLILATERPNCLILFTDPRFYSHIWGMEEEIHQVCPIVYNTLWDGRPYPSFNKAIYDSCDLFHCINWPTYVYLKERYPEKTHYSPHALPPEIYFPFPSEERLRARKTLFGNSADEKFILLWVNRNARRKRPNDVVVSWRMFLDSVQDAHGRAARDKCLLVMHTDARDSEGTDLPAVVDLEGVSRNVSFSTSRVGFDQMNAIYNAVDGVLNISSAEGLGLPTLEAMMCKTSIIASCTGGLTRQVIGSEGENGVALPIDFTSQVGSVVVPHISEDFTSNESTAAGILKLYEMGPDSRKELGERAYRHAMKNYDIRKLIERWDTTLDDLISRWNKDKRSVRSPWEIRSI